MHKILTALLLAVTTSALLAAEEIYKIDPVHSGVMFKIRHNFSKVPGGFKDFQGVIHYNPAAIEESHVEAMIKVNSVDTNNAKRDKHLLNEDFFNEPKFPEIHFKSTSWKQTSDNTFSITGDLTIMDTTQSVTLNAELIGKGKGEGHYADTTVTGWTATAQIDRSDFGITYGAPLVGNTVDIVLDIQAHMK